MRGKGRSVISACPGQIWIWNFQWGLGVSHFLHWTLPIIKFWAFSVSVTFRSGRHRGLYTKDQQTETLKNLHWKKYSYFIDRKICWSVSKSLMTKVIQGQMTCELTDKLFTNYNPTHAMWTDHGFWICTSIEFVGHFSLGFLKMTFSGPIYQY